MGEQPPGSVSIKNVASFISRFQSLVVHGREYVGNSHELSSHEKTVAQLYTNTKTHRAPPAMQCHDFCKLDIKSAQTHFIYQTKDNSHESSSFLGGCFLVLRPDPHPTSSSSRTSPSSKAGSAPLAFPNLPASRRNSARMAAASGSS